MLRDLRGLPSWAIALRFVRVRHRDGESAPLLARPAPSIAESDWPGHLHIRGGCLTDSAPLRGQVSVARPPHPGGSRRVRARAASLRALPLISATFGLWPSTMPTPH